MRESQLTCHVACSAVPAVGQCDECFDRATHDVAVVIKLQQDLFQQDH